MKRVLPALVVAALAMTACLSALALSVKLPGPTVTFPKGFSAGKARAVEAVLNDKRYHYVTGLYSHWPPAWSTTLVYKGDGKSMKGFVEGLRKVKGMRTRLTFSKDLSKETGSALTAGDWWVKYSQETPDVVTVRINLAGKGLDRKALPFTPEKDGGFVD